MDDIQKIIPLTKVKRHLLDIIKELGAEGATVTVTKNGEAAAIMMTPERYEGLLDTIEILGGSKTVKALAASTRDFKTGKIHGHSEVWGD